MVVHRHVFQPQLVQLFDQAPEQVELTISLLDPRREHRFDGTPPDRLRIDLGRAMVLDKGGDRCGSLTWPADLPAGTQLVVRTSIQVFGDIRLGDYDCSLTLPTPLPLDPWPDPGQRLSFRYRTDPEAGLEWGVLGPAFSPPSSPRTES